MTVAGKKTYTELCREAVELERQCKWSEAAELYVLASKRAKHPPARQAALAKADTAKRTAADHAEERAAEPRGLIGALTDTQERHMAEMLGHRAPTPDVLAGPPAGTVEAAMPTVPTELPAYDPGAGRDLSAQLAVIPAAQANEASWDAALPTAEELAAPDEDDEDEQDEEIADAVEAVVNPEPKTTNEETTMATTTTEKPKMSDREALLAKKERVRMKQNKIEVGTELQHIRRGKTLARCTYAAERCFIFDGKQYSSLSDAGSAAAKKLGMKNPSVNGWLFWGIEKREA